MTDTADFGWVQPRPGSRHADATKTSSRLSPAARLGVATRTDWILSSGSWGLKRSGFGGLSRLGIARLRAGRGRKDYPFPKVPVGTIMTVGSTAVGSLCFPPDSWSALMTSETRLTAETGARTAPGGWSWGLVLGAFVLGASGLVTQHVGWQRVVEAQAPALAPLPIGQTTPTPVTYWDYNTMSLDVVSLQSQLAAWTAEGWEVVSIIPVESTVDPQAGDHPKLLVNRIQLTGKRPKVVK